MKKILTTTLTLVALTLAASAASVYDVQFNDASGVALGDVDVATGGGFNNGAPPDNFGSTDGSGNMVWNALNGADGTSFATLDQTAGPYNISSTFNLEYNIRISNFVFDATTTDNNSILFELRDGSKLAYVNLRTSNGGNGVQIVAKGYTQSEINGGTLYDSGIAGTNNMTHAGWDLLDIKWTVNLSANTYDVAYRTKATDAFTTIISDETFGFGVDANFVDVDKLRLGMKNSFAAGDSISLDYVTVVTAVPEPSSTALLGLGGLALILRRRR
jgi:hypothetical protein